MDINGSKQLQDVECRNGKTEIWILRVIWEERCKMCSGQAPQGARGITAEGGQYAEFRPADWKGESKCHRSPTFSSPYGLPTEEHKPAKATRS